jgi:hypothetical protein
MVATPAPSTARTDFLVPSTTDESCHRSGPSQPDQSSKRVLENRTHGRDGVGRALKPDRMSTLDHTT